MHNVLLDISPFSVLSSLFLSFLSAHGGDEGELRYLHAEDCCGLPEQSPRF